ncbi:hypothetical protein [Clostridium sp.]|uniref:hypothetical protein n=1 Tax=Clostridium sp. TaxID=1506 RepID=UPI002FC9E4B6
MVDERFQLKTIKPFLIEDLGWFTLGIVFILFPIYMKFLGVFYAILLPIVLIYSFKGIILIVIDLVKQDNKCEELELFGLYPRKFDWLGSKNYHEIEFILKKEKS